MPRRRTIAGQTLLAALLVMGAAEPASAGFFERLFGGFIRSVRPPSDTPSLPRMGPLPGDRVVPEGNDDWRPSSEGGGPRMAYCVRTCDGHFFPVQANASYTAAQMCSAFCPASETKIFAGSGIDNAVGTDGRRYSDLPHAYAYRKKLVSNCTCNGKDVFGVARLDTASDPTLRRGDIVATRNGMMAVSATSANGASLTPADSYRGLSGRERQQIANMDNAPAPANSTQRQTGGRAPSDR
jgi:hypothetical protein